MVMAHDQNHIVTGGKDGSLMLWSLDASRPRLGDQAVATGVQRIVFLPDGNQAVIGWTEGTGSRQAMHLSLWDVTRRRKLRPLNTLDFEPKHFVSSADGQRLFVTDPQDRIGMLDLKTDEITSIHREVSGAIRKLFRAREAPLVFSYERDGFIEWFDDANGISQGTWSLPPGFDGTSIAVSPNARWLAACSRRGELLLHQLGSHHSPQIKRAHSHPSHDLTFIDDRGVATTSGYGDARIWRVPELISSDPMRGHLLGVHSVAAAPDGKRIVTGSGEGIVKLWDSEKKGHDLLSLPTGMDIIG